MNTALILFAGWAKASRVQTTAMTFPPIPEGICVMPGLRLREYSADDAAALLDLFRDTIRRVSIRDYTADQITAWSSDKVDLETWRARFEGRMAYVMADDGAVVGFVDMTDDGYLDRLFVSADHQRQGIATALVERLILASHHLGLDRIRTDASLTAEPFFRSLGFELVCEQTVECRGQTFVNFRMELHLARTSHWGPMG